MKGVFGIVGHVDHGKPTLFAAMSLVTESERGIVIVGMGSESIHDIIEKDRSIKLAAPEIIELKQRSFKSGKDNRRERRKQERKLKNK